MPVVYIDVVWAINLVMDAVLLFVTGWLMKQRVVWYRVLIGALVGACYALLLFFPTLSLLTTWPGKAIVSVAMVWIALPRKRMLDLLRLVGAYYFVSFVFAGASIALGFAIPGTSLGKALSTKGHGLMFATSGETLALMVAIPLCIYGMQRAIARIRRVHLRANWTVHVEVRFGTDWISFIGLVDSGNQLTDPVSHRPVSLVDVEQLKVVLPESIRLEIEEGKDLLTALATVASSTDFVLVPFQGASGRGLTIALKADEVILIQKGDRRIASGKHLFAVYPGQLSADGAFQAILHMDIMNGVDELERLSHAQADEPAITDAVASSVSSHSRHLTR